MASCPSCKCSGHPPAGVTLMPSYACPAVDGWGIAIPPGSCCAYYFAGTGKSENIEDPVTFYCPPGTFTQPDVPCPNSASSGSDGSLGPVLAIAAVIVVGGGAGLYLSHAHRNGGTMPSERRAEPEGASGFHRQRRR